MKVEKIKSIYFYPSLIGKIVDKKNLGNNFKYWGSDKSDQRISSPFVYFKHSFVEKFDGPNKSIGRPKKAKIHLEKPIKWLKAKDGITEFDIELLDVITKFIGLDNSQAVFWAEVDSKPKMGEFGEQFAYLIGLAFLGDYPFNSYIEVNNTEIKIPILVAEKKTEYGKYFKKNKLIKEVDGYVEEEANPYVLIVLQLSNEDSAEKDNNYVKNFIVANNSNIVSLLVRSTRVSFADENFISEYCVSKDGQLINMCARKDLFINVHERVAIAICTQETEEYIPELIESIAYLRALWYSFAASDFWLTKKITDYCEKIQKIEKDFNNISIEKISGDAVERIQELAGIKSLAISFMDEVITYKIQRGSLKGIIDALWNYFNMSNIKENLKFKVSQVDTLLNYLLEVQGRVMVNKINIKKR